MNYTPKNYISLEEMTSASIMEAHSDTVIDGIGIFGFVGGKAYAEKFVMDDDTLFAVADCAAEKAQDALA